jgi:hypothetical protein
MKEGYEMKVTLKDNEINSYVLTVKVEVEGKEYIADLSYNTYDGYEVTFLDDKGVKIGYPQWAIDYENNSQGADSLGYWLESQVGGFFKWEGEKVVANV